QSARKGKGIGNRIHRPSTEPSAVRLLPPKPCSELPPSHEPSPQPHPALLHRSISLRFLLPILLHRRNQLPVFSPSPFRLSWLGIVESAINLHFLFCLEFLSSTLIGLSQPVVRVS